MRSGEQRLSRRPPRNYPMLVSEDFCCMRYRVTLTLALSPTTHLTVTDPNDFRRLPPRELLRQGSQYHFLHFYRPLPRPSDRSPRLPAWTDPRRSLGGHFVSYFTRIFRVLFHPDISCPISPGYIMCYFTRTYHVLTTPRNIVLTEGFSAW
jgi:hypothetical protein